MGTTIHIHMLESMSESPERPPDHPHLEMIEEAVRSAGEILNGVKIPHRVRYRDDRDPEKLEPYRSSFGAGIDLRGVGTGCETIAYGWTWQPREQDYLFLGKDVWLTSEEVDRRLKQGERTPPGTCLRDPKPVWHGCEFTKTACARDFHLVHAVVCRIYEEWLSRELISRIEDEAEWYPDHDIEQFTGMYPGASQQALKYMRSIPGHDRLILNQMELMES